MSSTTSVGRGPAHGGNENHDGDPRNKTLGEKASPDEPPEGSEAANAAAARGLGPRPGDAAPAENEPSTPTNPRSKP
jgi:hypothetical protein